MVWYKPNTWFKDDQEQLDESIKAFKNKGDSATSDKQIQKESGEGKEDLSVDGYNITGLSSFNMFYKSYIDKKHKNEVQKIFNYRSMASAPEIADVLEDATNESTQMDVDGYILNFEVNDDSISKKENMMKKISDEFYDFFYNKLQIDDILWEWFYSYMVDGRIYYERLINESKQKEGIKGAKKLPSETMDYFYNPKTGRVDAYLQYLKKGTKKPKTIQEAEEDEHIVVFYPEQIGFIPYRLGKTKDEVWGYLENARIPFNQLKLLETSVVIYRIARAPERLVFKIDVGNMPRDKAMKFVNKIKQKMNKKQSYDPNSGTMMNTSDVLCIRKDTEIKLLDGRSIPLIDLVKEHKEGRENWVYSINEQTQEVEPGKIIDAQISRPNEKLIRVHLDDGSYVDTTHDHEFVMRDGSKKRADQLQQHDSLMPLYTKTDKIHPKLNAEYEHYFDLNDNKWKTTHSMVCEKTQRKREKNECIHHSDFDSFNNTPSNLQLVDLKEHIKYHGEHAKRLWEENYEKMYEAVVRGRETLKNDEEAFKAMRQKICDFWKDNYEYMVEKRKEQWRKIKLDPEKMKKKSEETAYWNLLGYNNYTELKEDYQTNTKVVNHRVQKIEYLEERDDTGCITVEGNHNFAVSFNGNTTVFVKNSIMDNIWIPQGDNKGSDVSTVGGNAAGFKELDDIHYFAKKLYRALKYPMSRIENRYEDRSGENLFRGNSMGEITRDEIKWAKFLERQQKKFINEFKDLFLLHLEFKGLKKTWGLSEDNLILTMTPPSDYREQMQQQLLETRFNNYLQLSNEPEFSKYFLMKKYLDWDEEDIKENADGKKKDKDLGLVPEEEEGGGFGF